MQTKKCYHDFELEHALILTEKGEFRRYQVIFLFGGLCGVENYENHWRKDLFFCLVLLLFSGC